MSQEKKMTLVEHLEELRFRIIHAVIAWVAASTGAYFFTPRLLGLFTGLVHTKLVFINPMEAFMAYLKIAMLLGFFVSLPFILFQILAFVVPGLEKHEKKWVLRLVPFAVLLFFLGFLFGCFVLIPIALKFFLSFATDDLVPIITIGGLVSFVLSLTIVSGLIFQTPMVILLLSIIGVVNSTLLREKRRYIILLFFILAAVATPTPDAFTQIVVAIPLILLYELSILIVRAIEKKKTKKVTTGENEQDEPATRDS
jgi:sec-independent protein translocase protein TatC